MKADFLDKEDKTDYELSRMRRFQYRTKYFTDSGIIGSKEFVAQIYDSIKHRLPSKREKTPQQVKGLEGIYSLKKFMEDGPLRS